MAKTRDWINQCARQILLPAGFHRGVDGFIRHDSPVFNYGDVQIYVESYTINVGFHYDFMPSMSMGPSRLEEFIKPDCMLGSRLPTLLEGKYGHDQWWPIEDNRESLVAALRSRMQSFVETLDEINQDWRDPAVLLQRLPPSYFEGFVQTEEESNRIRKAIKGWQWTFDNLLYALAVISKHVGDEPLMNEYRRIALAYPEPDHGELYEGVLNLAGTYAACVDQ